MDLDNIQRKYGLPAPLPVVQNGKLATRFPLNLEHRGDDVFQFGGKYIGEIENIYDLLYKILTNQEIDASLALPYAIKITEDKLYIRDKTNSEWILIFDITKPNFPKEIELYELIYKAITHQVIGEDTSYPGQFKIEENILYVRDKDNLTWTQIGDVTKEFLGATEATQAILDQVNEILIEVQELKTELNRQIATTNETLTTALQAANEAMTSAQSINIRTFNSVEEMKASNTLKAGALAKTLGFYTADDGGGADYVIVDDIGEDEIDEASIITLQKGLYAKLLVQDYINVKWFGAYIDNEHDDSVAFNNAVSFIRKYFIGKEFDTYKWLSAPSLIIPQGIMKIKSTIELDPSCCSTIFKGTIINAKELGEDSTVAIKIAGSNKGTYGCWGQSALEICGFRLIGSGKDNNKTGYIGSRNSDNYNQNNRYFLHNFAITGFTDGYLIGDNDYCRPVENFEIWECKNGLGAFNGENSGERLTFKDGTIFNCDKAINAGGTLWFINCSIDYNTQALQLDYAFNVYFKNCWFEWFSNASKDSHFKITNPSAFLTLDTCAFYFSKTEHVGDKVESLISIGDNNAYAGVRLIDNIFMGGNMTKHFNNFVDKGFIDVRGNRQLVDGMLAPLTSEIGELKDLPTNIYVDVFNKENTDGNLMITKDSIASGYVSTYLPVDMQHNFYGVDVLFNIDNIALDTTGYLNIGLYRNVNNKLTVVQQYSGDIHSLTSLLENGVDIKEHFLYANRNENINYKNHDFVIGAVLYLNKVPANAKITIKDFKIYGY